MCVKILTCGVVNMKNVHFEYAKVSRRFFWFLWLTYMLVYMTKSCFSAAMASIVAEGALTKSQTGLITSVFYIIYAPLQILGGVFADKYDPEKLVKISLLGAAVANTVIFFNQNYYVMLIAWAFCALAQFPLWTSIFKIISSQLYYKDRKSSVFYISFSSSAGLISAYLVAALISKWQYNFLISAVVLFGLAISFHIICENVGDYMIPDVTFNKKEKKTEKDAGQPSTFSLFVKSGFAFIVIISFCRIVVANAVNTLSPTMLMESYDGVSAGIGNLLNILVLGAGVVGTVLARTVIYPKLIKNEVKAILLLFAVSLIPCIVLIFIGEVSIAVAVFMMGVVACTLTAATYLSSMCEMHFAKYGKNGTAAGVMNSATSFGIVVQSYGVALLADNFSWNTVMLVLVSVVLLALLLCLAVYPLWKRFKKGL